MIRYQKQQKGICMSGDKVTDKLSRLEAQEALAKKRLAEIAAQKKALKIKADAMLQKQQRKDDTRRKIILGGVVVGWMKSNPEYASKLKEQLNGSLKAERDRALFGLPPLPVQQEAPQNANTAP